MGMQSSCCEAPSDPLCAEEAVTIYEEGFVADRLRRHAQRAVKNLPDLCSLEPKAFVKRVIKGGAAVDNGDWVQPIFRKSGGVWQLQAFEVLYRMSDAFGVPFPAFVNFVKAATDQSPTPDPELQQAFRSHALSSLQRVDARLSQVEASRLAAMSRAGLLTSLNFTAKQLGDILSVHLENEKLLAVEETEYDTPPQGLSAVRHQLWQRLGKLSLDDVKPTLADVVAFAEGVLDYEPPRTPQGAPFKPLCEAYTHDFPFARQFIADFRQTLEDSADARADLKLDEEFCCYFVGVGHAPFSRDVMAAWSQRHPVTAAAIKRAGLELIREALAAGMGLCLEVSFEDRDVQWLHAALPELDGRLYKQGGRSGSIALPQSLVEAELLATDP